MGTLVSQTRLRCKCVLYMLYVFIILLSLEPESEDTPLLLEAVDLKVPLPRYSKDSFLYLA